MTAAISLEFKAAVKHAQKRMTVHLELKGAVRLYSK